MNITKAQARGLIDVLLELDANANITSDMSSILNTLATALDEAQGAENLEDRTLQITIDA